MLRLSSSLNKSKFVIYWRKCCDGCRVLVGDGWLLYLRNADVSGESNYSSYEFSCVRLVVSRRYPHLARWVSVRCAVWLASDTSVPELAIC
jgi:hypothetical protein